MGVSGCNVCHADRNLVKPGGATNRSVFVDPELMKLTAHKDIVCTGCHGDFAFKTPHKNAATDAWRKTAKGNCKNCHEKEAGQVASGRHTSAGKPGVSEKALEAERVANGNPPQVPLCGDCHGAHDIMPLNVEQREASGTIEEIATARKGRANLHSRGIEICGACHGAEADTYADYYHGAAYRRGASDAPACWDCHGAHEMLPASDSRSPVNPQHLVETCGRCHKDANESYIQYAELVHRRAEVRSAVPIFAFIDSTRSVIQGAFATVASWF